ncbi:hypothetical protein C6P45_004299 [Maudiozyma exigua]|uniref:Uncharacterized protein n=1 Tax=Maudiozyma exigua TaxID=34358 RepID=A0A9P6WAL3_MAUEX|nr:hypothetical protein C6P45_004299 [Kazachstania exigua]
MKPITSFFKPTKRPSNTPHKGVAKMAHIETLVVKDGTSIPDGDQTTARANEEESSNSTNDIQTVVPRRQYNQGVTFEMLSMICTDDYSNNVSKLFARLTHKDQNHKTIRTFCQIFNRQENKVCNHCIIFDDEETYKNRNDQNFKAHLVDFHIDIDPDVIPDPSAYLCTWSHVQGIKEYTTITEVQKSETSKRPDVFQEFCMWIAVTKIPHSAVDMPSFQNGIGLRIDQFGPHWTGENVTRRIALTGGKISRYLYENCDQLSKMAEPSLIINTNASTAQLYTSLLSQFCKIKKLGSVFCSIASDDWLSKENSECSAFNINFLDSGVTLHTITIRLFTSLGKSKKAHTKLLKSTVKSYKCSKLLSSVTTDNCSAILGAADNFKDGANFPAFKGHIGCLGNQIFLISNSDVREFSKSFESISDSQFEELMDEEEADYEIPLEEYEAFDFDDDTDSTSENFQEKKDLLLEGFRSKRDIQEEKQKLDDYRLLGERISKTENYRDSVNERINVQLYNIDPFEVGKRFPYFTERRWHIKVYLLELFSENKTKISEFLREAENKELNIQNVLSEDDMYDLEFLFEALRPLVLINKLVKNKLALISNYAPILFEVKKHIADLQTNIRLKGRHFDADIPLKKVDEFIERIRKSYPIVGLASLFHINSSNVLEELNVKILAECAELAYKMVVFGTIDNSLENGSIASYSKSSLTDTTRHTFNKENEEIRNDGISMNNGCNKTILEHLELLIKTELDQFKEFFISYKDEELIKIAKKKKFNVEISGGNKYFTRTNGNCISQLSSLESMPLLIEASANAITKYRAETIDPSSEFRSHSILPCIIALIFSMSATSINCDRSFSDENIQFYDKRCELYNKSIFGGVLISGALSELNISPSLKELKVPLYEQLKTL